MLFSCGETVVVQKGHANWVPKGSRSGYFFFTLMLIVLSACMFFLVLPSRKFVVFLGFFQRSLLLLVLGWLAVENVETV